MQDQGARHIVLRESGKPIELSLHTTALLVVDMQNDFCHPHGYYARVGRPVDRLRLAIEPLSRLLAAARAAGLLIVFTRLVHDSRIPDVGERHHIMPEAWVARDYRLGPGSWGAEIVEELTPQPNEFVIDKADYSSFYGTELEQILRRRGIRTLIITGTVAYACVLHTAFDAFVRDFDVIVAKEAVSSWFDDLQTATFRIIELLLGRVLTCDEILALLAVSLGTSVTTRAQEERA